MQKQLPFSLEAEQSVLGSILLRPAESFEAIGNMLTADSFYAKEHGLIFSVLQNMYNENRSIDAVTVVNRLVEEGMRDQTSGAQYIAQIAEMVPSVANIRDYVGIVYDKYLLRRLIAASDEVTQMAYAEEGDAETIVDNAEQLFFEIAQKRDTKEFRHIRDVIGEVYRGYMDLSNKVNQGSEIKTGFSGLDRTLVELGKGDFVLVGARPGMGKTTFALNVAANVAKSSGKTVCIFSLEMPAEQLVNRLMASEAMVENIKLRSGDLNSDEWTRLAHAATTLSKMDILIDDTSSINPIQIKAKLRRVQNLGLVVIDYLGLLQSARKIENRVQEVSDITRSLKILAKDLNVPLLCCAQLSRGTEGRNDKRPQLSDLRDSGSIEQDADMVLFLYRAGYYESKDQAGGGNDTNTAEVIIAKNRHGSLGNVEVGWIPQYSKFCTLDHDSTQQ